MTTSEIDRFGEPNFGVSGRRFFLIDFLLKSVRFGPFRGPDKPGPIWAVSGPSRNGRSGRPGPAAGPTTRTTQDDDDDDQDDEDDEHND